MLPLTLAYVHCLRNLSFGAEGLGLLNASDGAKQPLVNPQHHADVSLKLTYNVFSQARRTCYIQRPQLHLWQQFWTQWSAPCSSCSLLEGRMHLPRSMGRFGSR